MGTIAMVIISLAVGGVVGLAAGRWLGAKRARDALLPALQTARADAIVDFLRLVNEHRPRDADVAGLVWTMYPTISDYVQARLRENPTRPA